MIFLFIARSIFIQQEAGLTQPVYAYTITGQEYFATTSDFAAMKIETKDTGSFKYHAVLLLQEAIRFHLNDTDKSAIIDLELKRLRFMYDNAIVSNKEIVYENALRTLADMYPDNPETAEVLYKIAELSQQPRFIICPKSDRRQPIFQKKARIM
ncbi:MAG: hypothetical protein MZV63_15200 [Marinilabiliales bacterium]|nr:hypothetical protein [Marinilabiliales bacterium]